MASGMRPGWELSEEGSGEEAEGRGLRDSVPLGPPEVLALQHLTAPSAPPGRSFLAPFPL